MSRSAPVALMLVVHFILGITSARMESPTFDETVHLSAGYCFWKFNDYRMNPENGNLPQRWAAIPLIADTRISAPNFVENPSLESNEWLTSFQFLYGSGNDPDSMFIRGRAMMLVVSAMLGLCVFLISKSLFGYPGGLVSLLLYCLSPTILAHGRLVTSDIFSVLAFILSAWTLWKLLHRVDLKNLAASSLSVSMLCLSKMSAPIILPVFAILLAARLMARFPLELDIFGWKSTIDSQVRQLGVFVACGIVNCAVAVFLIWASCGFRYEMIDAKYGKSQNVARNWELLQSDNPGPTEKAINLLRSHRVLPEAFLFGYQFVMKKSQFRYAFLNGETRLTGWWYFFPYCFLVKTPIPELLLMLIVAFYAFRRISVSPGGPLPEGPRAKIWAALPLMVLCAVYLVFAFASNMNIGHRHILLLYPCAYILMGASASLVAGAGKMLKAILAFLVLWFSWNSFSIHPHYLAFFNKFAGGPSDGYRHLVDSSLDWGQDLITLRKWLDRNNIAGEDVYISYFGTASIDHYLRARKLPSYMGQEGDYAFRLGGGIYCISATMRTLIYVPELFDAKDLSSGLLDENLYMELESELEPLFSAEGDPEEQKRLIASKGRDYWVNKYRLLHLLRFAKIAKFIQPREPDANAGYSILIYRLSDKDVAEALAIPFRPGFFSGD